MEGNSQASALALTGLVVVGPGVRPLGSALGSPGVGIISLVFDTASLDGSKPPVLVLVSGEFANGEGPILAWHAVSSNNATATVCLAEAFIVFIFRVSGSFVGS